jgi:hypothetical protein
MKKEKNIERERGRWDDDFKYVSDHVVEAFINKNNLKYNGELTHHFNFSRVACLADFQQTLNRYNLKNFQNVSVVSGSVLEPELRIIDYNYLDILNFDVSSNLWNLDEDWSKLNNYKNDKYDLVFCNQVLEHVYSPLQALKNLSYIARSGGYIWVSVPVINCIHGEPFFFSSGYHPRYLKRLANNVGLECVHLGAWGNKNYLVSAVIGKWLTYAKLKNSFYNIKEFIKLFTFKNSIKNDLTGNYITDTWALLKKKSI